MADQEPYTMVFQPSGARGKIAAGTNLREAARQVGVDIESVCAENPTCGKCRVQIETSWFDRLGIASSLDHLSPLGAVEESYMAPRLETSRQTGQDVSKLRVACQAKVYGDLLVFAPEASLGSRQIVRKSATERRIDIRPIIRKYYVEMEPPAAAHPLGDWERLSGALVRVMQRVRLEPGWKETSPNALAVDYPVLRKPAETLRARDWKVTVTVQDDREVIDVQAGYHEQVYGAAVDIGSTTIARYLCDLHTGEIVARDSMMNPQTAY